MLNFYIETYPSIFLHAAAIIIIAANYTHPEPMKITFPLHNSMPIVWLCAHLCPVLSSQRGWQSFDFFVWLCRLQHERTAVAQGQGSQKMLFMTSSIRSGYARSSASDSFASQRKARKWRFT